MREAIRAVLASALLLSAAPSKALEPPDPATLAADRAQVFDAAEIVVPCETDAGLSALLVRARGLGGGLAVLAMSPSQSGPRRHRGARGPWGGHHR